MLNDYTIGVNKPITERLEKFDSSCALNMTGGFPYGIRVIRRTVAGEHVYEKYRGGYTKAHPDYYLVDTNLRHARLGITKTDIEAFEQALNEYKEALINA